MYPREISRACAYPRRTIARVLLARVALLRKRRPRARARRARPRNARERARRSSRPRVARRARRRRRGGRRARGVLGREAGVWEHRGDVVGVHFREDGAAAETKGEGLVQRPGGVLGGDERGDGEVGVVRSRVGESLGGIDAPDRTIGEEEAAKSAIFLLEEVELRYSTLCLALGPP